MTKAELVDKVQAAKEIPELSKKDIQAIIDATFANIAAAIRKEKRFALPDFGVFTVRKRAARKGRNPQTGKEINIKASKTVGFKPAKTLKDKL